VPEESIFSVSARWDAHPRPVSIGGGVWLPQRFTALFDDPVRPVYGEVVVEVSAEGEPYLDEVRIRPRIAGREEIRARSVEAVPPPERQPVDQSKKRTERLADALEREPAELVRAGEPPPDDRVPIGSVHTITIDDLRVPVASLLTAAVRAAAMGGPEAEPGTRAGPGLTLRLTGTGPVAGSPRRRKLTDALLAEVYDVWRRANAEGSPTRAAVAEHFGLESELTARNWIHAARDLYENEDDR
jgi:hypothetical protein